MTAAATDALTRLRWVDGARGIGILLVVYAHAERALFSWPTAPQWAMVTDRTIYAFHMPLFFLLAGLFVWQSLARGRWRFVADKLVTVVYPYFFWSLVEGGLEVSLGNRVNTPLSLHDLASIPVTPIQQFWFLYVLALCFGLALACYPRRWTVALIGVAGLVSAGRYGTASMPLRALAFFPFLGAGILGDRAIFALGRSTAGACAVLAGALLLFAAGIVDGWNGVVVPFVLALAGSFTAIAAAVLLDRSVLGAPLALLGRASLAIYVMHTIFSAGVRIVAHAASLAVPLPVMLVITTLAGLAGPLGVWLAAERLGISEPLGLGRLTRRKPSRTAPARALRGSTG